MNAILSNHARGSGEEKRTLRYGCGVVVNPGKGEGGREAEGDFCGELNRALKRRNLKGTKTLWRKSFGVQTVEEAQRRAARMDELEPYFTGEIGECHSI